MSAPSSPSTRRAAVRLADLPTSSYVVTHRIRGTVYGIRPLRPLRIGGRLFGTHGLWLWHGGEVRGGTILEPLLLPGSREQVPALTTLFFHPNGAIRRVTLARPVTVQGRRCPSQLPLRFSLRGRLLGCE